MARRPLRNASNRSDGRRPRSRAARGGDGDEALTFEYQPVELPLADDDLVRFPDHLVPAVKLRVRARGGEHLRGERRGFGVSGQLEERKLPHAVEDGERDQVLVPAQEMEVNYEIGNPPIVEVPVNPARQGLVILGGKIDKIVLHAAQRSAW